MCPSGKQFHHKSFVLLTDPSPPQWCALGFCALMCYLGLSIDAQLVHLQMFLSMCAVSWSYCGRLLLHVARNLTGLVSSSVSNAYFNVKSAPVALLCFWCFRKQRVVCWWAFMYFFFLLMNRFVLSYIPFVKSACETCLNNLAWRLIGDCGRILRNEYCHVWVLSFTVHYSTVTS